MFSPVFKPLGKYCKKPRLDEKNHTHLKNFEEMALSKDTFFLSLIIVSLLNCEKKPESWGRKKPQKIK